MCHVQTCSDLNRRAEQNPGKTTCEHLRTMMSTELMMNYDERTRFGYSGYSPATLDRIWTPGPEDCHLAKGRFGPGAPTQHILQCPIAVVAVCHSVTVVRMRQDMSCFYLFLELILPSWGTKQFFINPISDPCENSGHPVQTAKENLSALDSDQTVVCRYAIKLERLNYIHPPTALTHKFQPFNRNFIKSKPHRILPVPLSHVQTCPDWVTSTPQ